MIRTDKIDKIKKILLNTLDNEGFVQELLEKYKGNEELILQMIEESFGELMEEANPYKWKPVSPATFLTDPYYLGKNPDTGIGVCDTLHEPLFKDFCELHAEDKEYNEAILTGGIGWGKSFFMEISLIWQLYLLSCLKHPQKHFDLASNSKLTVMVISITEKQGKKNIFSGVKEALKIIPYFKEHFQYDDKRAADSLIFPNNIELMNATSSHSSTIGLNIYAAALDEANFFKKVSNSKRAQDVGEIYDEALVLYQSVRRRLDARFMKKGHKPGIFYIGSSKVYPNDFTTERINKAMELEKENGIKKCFVMDYNLWKVKREAYTTEEFRVEIGGLNRRSRILEEWDSDIVGEVINVPMDFYDKFKDDIDGSIRDIAGIGIYTVQPFIGNKAYIGKMFEYGTEIGLERIFSVDEATLSPKPAHMAIEHILNTPIRKPGAIRYVGIDIGLKKDKLGFALGYIDGMEDVHREYFDAATQTLKTYKDKLPKCIVEMMLSVKKEEEFGEVELARVRYLIFQLIKKGYKIRMASMDGFQSADFMQILKRNNIEATYISMDKTTEPYETLRTALYEERVASTYHPLLELELNELERDYSKQKIDHNARGSKDLSDAVGQIIYNMHINPMYNETPLLPVALHDASSVSSRETMEDTLENFNKWAMKG